MILVIGSTGTTGRLVLQRLGDAGVPARALVRPSSAAVARRHPALPGVTVVLGDAGDPESLRAALRGVDRVFLAMGNGPDQLHHELAVVREAARSGVAHLVKVSAPLVGPDVPVAVARTHHRVEEAVRAAALDHTFLRPYAFLQNLLHSAPTIRLAGFFSGITGDTPLNMVDARDVAEVAVVALTAGGGRGPLVLTGPESVSYPEVARRLTALGHPTRFVDLDPVDVTDADDARWLRACLWPDQPERVARLEAEMALAATAPPLLLQGDAVEVLPDAFARVPADALPVVTTTWALSHFPLESRLRFLHRLDEAAAGRAVAWVSAEGVGVAPAIPTLGDRRASGHSIIGLAVFDRSALRAEATGRCWSQGRLLAWLADS